MSAKHAATALIAALLVASCTGTGSDAPSDRPSDWRTASGELTVVEGSHEINVPYAVGDQLYAVPGAEDPDKLGGVVNAPFLATLAPLAVPDTSGRFVVYHSIRQDRPVLLVRELKTRDETTLAEGAFSLAWRRDGALAYFTGVRPRVRDPQRYVGDVVVAPSLDARAKRWTTERNGYVVAAWAGESLIVHRQREGWPDVLMLDGPGRARVLAERAALVAVSPDGSRAFVTKEPARAPIVGVVNVADGSGVATLDLATASKGVATEEGTGRDVTANRLTYVADSGSWVADEIVASVSGGLAVLRLDTGAIVLEQLLRIDAEMFPTDCPHRAPTTPADTS